MPSSGPVLDRKLRASRSRKIAPSTPLEFPETITSVVLNGCDCCNCSCACSTLDLPWPLSMVPAGVACDCAAAEDGGGTAVADDAAAVVGTAACVEAPHAQRRQPTAATASRRNA